jgi:hypothetical protein
MNGPIEHFFSNVRNIPNMVFMEKKIGKVVRKIEKLNVFFSMRFLYETAIIYFYNV